MQDHYFPQGVKINSFYNLHPAPAPVLYKPKGMWIAISKLGTISRAASKAVVRGFWLIEGGTHETKAI